MLLRASLLSYLIALSQELTTQFPFWMTLRESWLTVVVKRDRDCHGPYHGPYPITARIDTLVGFERGLVRVETKTAIHQR